MGFTSIEKNAEKAAKTNKKKFGKSNAQQLEMKFTPSTKKEIKEYARRAAEADEAKKNSRNGRAKNIKLDLEKNLPFDFRRPKALRRVFNECMEERHKLFLKDKLKHPKWAPRMPRYEMFEQRKLADSNFVYDMQSCIAGFSWVQLNKLINAAAGAEIKTKDYSEAFHLFQNVMHQALGVELDSSGTRYRLSDRDEVLADWNIDIIHRKRKMPKKDEDEKVKKVRATAKEKDEEEEVEDEEEEDDEASEDEEDEEDEAEDEDEDEEEEKPKAKKKKPVKAAKKKKRIPKDEDEDDDADEEEEDDEEEDAEETEDEDEEDEDDEPKKSTKGKKPVAKKAKKAEKEDKPKRTAKVAVGKITDASIIKRTSKVRAGGGTKGALYALVTKKGLSYKKLLAAAEAAELPVAKVKKWIPMMIQNGYVAVE